jgi:uncharacterized protein YjbJ (UPF0337 family)
MPDRWPLYRLVPCRPVTGLVRATIEDEPRRGGRFIVDDDTRMRFEGRWQEMRGRVKEAWGDLTDDDLDKTEGKWDQVVGAVKRKTGESVDAVEARLRGMMD